MRSCSLQAASIAEDLFETQIIGWFHPAEEVAPWSPKKQSIEE
jgi:hypothetical protein